MKSAFARTLVSVSALVTVLGLGSCGWTGGDYSCDLRPVDPQCTDWRGLIGPHVTQEAVCATLNSAKGGGMFATGACPRQDRSEAARPTPEPDFRPTGFTRLVPSLKYKQSVRATRPPT